MYDAIKENVEEMIQDFFRYGIKDALSVDEFLKFREQAVKEQMMGILGNNSNLLQKEKDDTHIQNEGYSKNIQTSKKITPDIKKTIQNSHRKTKRDTYPDYANNKYEKNIPSKIDNSKEIGKTNKNPEEENQSGFSDNDFIAMMKSVED